MTGNRGLLIPGLFQNSRFSRNPVEKLIPRVILLQKYRPSIYTALFGILRSQPALCKFLA